jgi:alpha-glucosidase
MMTRFFTLWLVLATAVIATEVKSPDGHLVVDVRLNTGGAPVYDVRRDGVVVLGESRLGLVRADADFSRGLKLTGESKITLVTDRYELPTSKRLLNTYKAKRRVYALATAGGLRMDVVFQVSNDGVAFRYVFPEKSSAVMTVEAEETSFCFPAETKAWLQPMSVAKTGWAHTNPSYEEYHQMEIPVGTPSTSGAGWVFPALFRTGDTWILITEAGLGRGYCASRLAHESPGGEYRIGFPDTRETMGDATVNPQFATPYATPWRVMAIGSLKTVTESALGTDLADPAVKTAKLAGTPGKASWSWPKLGDKQTTFEVQRRFVDFAADMGWTYCLVDAMWDTQIGYEKMQELSDYARAKNVLLLVWYNSNGSWNDAFQTPKNRMVTRELRRAEFARLRKMGIAGVKVDFFGGDGRVFVDLYHDILEDAAEFGILVNFHGATLPRGWERTYPNLMTAEAVRGFEFITFEQGNADRAPVHMAMLPFTRNVFDAMDFTPLSLARLPKIKLRTTPAAELATAVLFTSGIQHYVEIPEGMAKQPDYVQAVLKRIPSVWTDSRFLEGYPGKLAVFARRGADGRWWVAGFNGEGSAKTVEVSLAGLGKGKVAEVTVITDGESGAWARNDRKLEGKARTLRVELKPYGGFLTEVE